MSWFSTTLKRRPSGAAGAHVSIGGVPLPESIEGRHFAMVGATGGGKTVAIRSLLRTLKQRGDACLVVDSGGELLAEFGSPDDVILSPVDGRSARWDPVAELTTAADADRVALALIPPGGNASEEEWNSYARSLATAVLRVARDLDELVGLLFDTPSYSDPQNGITGLDELLKGTPAGLLFQPGGARMLSSIRGITGSKLMWLPYAAAIKNRTEWTAKNWAATLDRKPQNVWLPVRADHSQMLAPYVSAVVQQSIVQILSQPIRAERRVWIFIDELGAYPKVSSLIQALTQGRKYGARVVLGYQSVSQTVGSYGFEDAQTIASCLGTFLILRQGDAQSAEWASKMLGSREVLHRMQGQSVGGNSSSETLRDEPLVLASELMRLADLKGYLRVPGNYPVGRVALPIPPRFVQKTPVPAHVPAPWLGTIRATAPADSSPPMAPVTTTALAPEHGGVGGLGGFLSHQNLNDGRSDGVDK